MTQDKGPSTTSAVPQGGGKRLWFDLELPAILLRKSSLPLFYKFIEHSSDFYWNLVLHNGDGFTPRMT